jgi:Ca2+-binding EF-hand superfamily protein
MRLKADPPADDGKIPATFKEIEEKYKFELKQTDMNFLEFMKVFANRKMIRGEIKFIFDTIDIDKNSKIS